jgi:hypothetical protein
MLQLGMVADACEIVVRLIRFVDNERFKIAELPHHIDALRTSATELFQNEGCLTLDGFTKQMVTLIRRPRLVTLSGGRPKTLGDTDGPRQDIVARCLGRMVYWWRLVEAVLETEFPEWDLLMQFQAFRVPRNLVIESQTRDQLLRLSANFGLDPGQVLSEYEDWCPLATQFARQIASATASDVSLQAWQRTVKHVGKKACDKSSLLKLLHRFVAYIGSASKVEQTFSQCMAQFRHIRNFSSLGGTEGAGDRGHPRPIERGGLGIVLRGSPDVGGELRRSSAAEGEHHLRPESPAANVAEESPRPNGGNRPPSKGIGSRQPAGPRQQTKKKH